MAELGRLEPIPVLGHDPVTATVTARRDGAALEAAGSIPITFSAWDIKGPAGYGPIASLANHGTAEFLISAHRS